MMKTYEITAPLRPGAGQQLCHSSRLGDGFWDLSQSCGHGQRSGPVGLQAQDVAHNQSYWGHVGHAPHFCPLLSFAQAWLLVFLTVSFVLV